MTSPAQTLADFAVGLRYDHIPAEVIERAKDCIIDTVGACVFGAQLPWTQTVIGYAERNSAPGQCSVLGTPTMVRAPFACLANGAAAHAFELDALCEPSVGIHPSAAIAVPALAVSQGRRVNGRDLLTAFVAGYEVLYRIGDAARHSIEKVGFHSPGVVGVYGTAAVVGKLFGLDIPRMANAFGIAGSMSSGLMEFSRSGGMVKRLHLGRAAEGGFMAAILARDGYTGPAEIFEGKYGFLNVYCRNGEAARFTQALGSTWHVMKTKIKRYACHSTAQVPVTLALDLKAEYGISGEDVARITIAANEKTVTQHAIREPRDMTMMQYSVPFSTALALFRDPTDPRVFSEAALNDAQIRALAATAEVLPLDSASGSLSSACRVTLHLKRGGSLSADGHDFRGTPTQPLTRAELREKFLKLAAHREAEKAGRLFSQLAETEKLADMSALDYAL
ncbi:MAG TPA: MmgE/PrpD family protein [Burkholderiales bacterium]|nr:MmgE/PrpD family protein [Burkholderiales bacterium]